MVKKPIWATLTPSEIRQATAKILTGRNYRLFFEDATRRTLIQTCKDLSEFAKLHPTDNKKWMAAIRKLVETGSLDDRRKRTWLFGLAAKTAKNLNVETSEYPRVFDDMMSDICDAMSTDIERREAALLLWCGAATLTIRGSRKAKIGKALERSLAGALLTILGLRENKDYRLNIKADQEVGRETDAEVRTRRGWLRMEVGLIGEGNSEVISDKVGRMNRNDVILMDMIPVRSSAYDTAKQRGVHLIQLRNMHPVEEVRMHLKELGVNVAPNQLSPAQVEKRVMGLPLTMFERRGRK